jgi:hypothetical protein
MSDSSKNAAVALGTRVWELPPLILHPFANEMGPGQLLEGSKAALQLCGLLPGGEDREELTRKLLHSRYAEIRMLSFVGKDLRRWLSQCLDLLSRTHELQGKGICLQSFAALLVYHAPSTVLDKLHKWGVAKPESVFSRALGLSSVFRDVPQYEQLSDDFMQYYHRFADHLFVCEQQLVSFTEITAANFSFELYASGEYSRMLEAEWGEKP